MVNKDALCIAYAADDNYAKYLGISMLSLFQSNKGFVQIDVFVLDCEIGAENKEKLMSIVEEYNRKIHFISMKNYVSNLELNMGARKISIASYARLFLATVIPDTYERILYLDCDTIVLDELNDFWNIDMVGYMVAGVRDTVDSYFLKKIGLKPEDFYINAGIILVNLAAWRENQLLTQFITFIKKFDGNVPHHDQGTINAVCKDQIRIVSPRFNVTSNIYSFSTKTIRRMYNLHNYYSQQSLDKAKHKPAILHYTTGLVGRPWEENCTHPRKEEYSKVASRSPWKAGPLLPDSRTRAVRMFSAFYKFAPHCVSEVAYRISSWIIYIKD